MSLLTLHVELELDGKPVPGFPYIRCLDLPDGQGLSWDVPVELNPRYRSAPIHRLALVNGVLLLPDEMICVRFNGMREGEVVIPAGGCAILWDCILDADATENVTVLRFSLDPAPVDAVVDGYAGGVALDDETLYPPTPTPTTTDEGFGEGGFD